MACFNHLTGKIEGVGAKSSTTIVNTSYRGAVKRQSVAQVFSSGAERLFTNMVLIRSSTDFVPLQDGTLAIVIPASVSLVRGYYGTIVSSSVVAISTWIRHENSSGVLISNYWGITTIAARRRTAVTSVFSVSEGDRLWLACSTPSAISTTVVSQPNDASWFEIEVIE